MKISLVGVGMGNGKTLTVQALQALDDADVVLGASRLLDALPQQGDTLYLAFALPSDVAQQILQHPEWDKVCVVLSGDVGFYSGASKLKELLCEFDLEFICGISSPQQLAAKLQRPWQDFKLVSAHGKACDVLAEVLNHPAVCFITGTSITPQTLCEQLVGAELGSAKVSVGENLGADNERIVCGIAAELAQQEFALLSIVLVENLQRFDEGAISPGIADDAFVRGKAPMTKREVRVNILALLNIHLDDVLFDVGAGTGSVSIEMALLARRGWVHAIECEPESCELIKQNKEEFCVSNLSIVQGKAPDALQDLPTPQAAFVGGSKGNMRAILDALYEKNPDIRIVISAVTLETLHEAMAALKAIGITKPEVVQIAVSHAVQTGDLHMLRAQNPIFLISGGGCDEV